MSKLAGRPPVLFYVAQEMHKPQEAAYYTIPTSTYINRGLHTHVCTRTHPLQGSKSRILVLFILRLGHGGQCNPTAKGHRKCSPVDMPYSSRGVPESTGERSAVNLGEGRIRIHAYVSTVHKKPLLFLQSLFHGHSSTGRGDQLCTSQAVQNNRKATLKGTAAASAGTEESLSCEEPPTQPQ
ncbi:hypothetical protein UY3_18590 [Chelonia mydas]|uniref:Uncharacterized protein n=1 Tax=Chelonia mydas TaxID=8469 RepID=M7B7Y1_CHEMY|nr:hypothetical protein UY3_18590 [Chelonia mydas]